MKIDKPEAKEKLVQRLRRIEGQVRGIQAMVNDERDCTEILQQLSAVRSAVQSASRIFLQEYAASCLVRMETGESSVQDREKMVQDMIALLDKAP
jgi:DNA-binding FrmR family transcriptional regulator